MSAAVRRVAVCGAGAMGVGIAEVALRAGDEVLVVDLSDSALAAGRERLSASLEAQVSRRRITAAAAADWSSRCAWSCDLAAAAAADLVIEAIVEDESAKIALIRRLETVVAPEAIIASNTSSLPIGRLAEACAHPERFIGLHFFNPAPVMRLVEVVATGRTDPGLAALATAVMERWGKRPVAVADVPGFVVNRVARPFYAEAFLALADGIPPELIDQLFRNVGFRMGPLELTDLIGQDINFAVAESVHAAYAGRTRFRPAPAQRDLVAAGRLGRKSGAGVYHYADGTGPMPPPPLRDPGAAAPRGSTLPRPWCQPNDGFHEIDGALVGISRGRSAAAEAAEAGRPVAVFDWCGDPRIGLVAFAASDEAAAGAAVRCALAAGLVAHRIADRPGLVVLRTLVQLANAAADAVVDRVSNEAGIDGAMIDGANYPFGPFAWTDRYGRSRASAVSRRIGAETRCLLYDPPRHWEDPHA